MGERRGARLKQRRTLACLAAAALAAVRAAAQSNALAITDAYTVRRWGVEDGLPEGIVTGVARFPDGFLWLTTPHHVARFDGVEFRPLSREAYPDKKPKRLNGILRDRRGCVWVSGEDGVLLRDAAGAWSSVPLEGEIAQPLEATWTVDTPDGELEQPPRFSLFWVRESRDGSIWVASNAGLYLYDGQRFRLVPSKGGARLGDFLSAAMDEGGAIWLVGRDGLLVYRDGAYAPRPFPAAPGRGRLFQVFAGRGESLWGKRLDGNLYRRRGEEWEDIPPGGLRLTALLERPGDEVWLGSPAGLHRWCQGRWHALVGGGLPRSPEVRCLAETEDGSLWAGTGNGLLLLRPRLIRMFTASRTQGAAQAVTAVLQQGGGALLVGTASRGLFSGPPDALAPCSLAGLARDASVSALLRGRDGTLWVGTQRDHLWNAANGGALRQNRSQADLSSRDITALVEDAAGRLWIGTREGLRTLDARGWLVPAGGPEDAVLALCGDGAGGLWVGCQSSGLWRRSAAGAWAGWGVTNGLPAETVRCLLRDAEGRLWAATPKGLASVEGPASTFALRVSRYGREQGLPDDDIRQLLDDGEGSLWLGTRQAVLRVSKDELAAVAGARKAVVTPRLFGRSDGLAGELTGGDNSGPLAARLADGRLAFATQSGLAVLEPSGLRAAQAGTPVYVEGLDVAGRPQLSALSCAGPAAARLELPAGSRDIEVSFTSPSFAAPEQMLFRTRLEGYDAEWSRPQAERRAVYGRLPPGEYVFRVMASSAAGGWSEASAPLRFEVRTFFWQTAWFLALSVGLAMAAAGLCGGLWVRRRSRRKLEAARRLALARERELAREQAVERERARIARDIHDDLGAGLTQVALLSELAQAQLGQPEQLRPRLDKIFETARSLAQGLNEIVWAVNPNNDTLDSMLSYLGSYADDYLRASGLSFRLDIPTDCPELTVTSAVRHHLFCAVREALHNAVKHAGPCEIRVRAAAAAGGLEVEVADTGRGFDPAAVAPAAGRHNGLANLRHRMQETGGSFELASAPGRGTRIRLRVNIGPAPGASTS